MTNSDHYLFIIEMTTPARARQSPSAPEVVTRVFSAVRALYAEHDESVRLNVRLSAISELEHEMRQLP